MGRGEVQKLSVVDGALNEGALTAGLIKSRCLVILSWFLFGKGNFFGFLIVAKIVSDNLANMGYTDAGEGLVQQLLARSDLVLLALAPEISAGYGKIFAYLNDNLNQAYLTVDLATRVLRQDRRQRLALQGRRAALGNPQTAQMVPSTMRGLCGR